LLQYIFKKNPFNTTITKGAAFSIECTRNYLAVHLENSQCSPGPLAGFMGQGPGDEKGGKKRDEKVGKIE